MLSFRQIDDIPDSIVDLWEKTQTEIINDMVRRISRLGKITDSTLYQKEKLVEMGLVNDEINKRLAEALNITETKLTSLFDEAASRTLATDDAIYREAGLSPTPLSENKAMQQLLWAGIENTKGEMRNYTNTTANTASGFFEEVLDRAYDRISTGAFDYQSSIRMAIKELTAGGLFGISYPSGHRDYIDTATRRAVLTGVSQAAAKLQEMRFNEMGAEFVETTAHMGARTAIMNGPANHAWWQGKVFYWNRTGLPNTTSYPDFVQNTGYGTGEGLCGWNCRHSFYPFYPGISETSNTIQALKEMNGKTVTYNGKEMSLYDATQKQRELERYVRRWKRELSGMEAGNQDLTQSKDKIKYWQATLRDFISQTKLDRDYFRERAGNQLL